MAPQAPSNYDVNSSISIHCLPEEILSFIFKTYVSLNPEARWRDQLAPRLGLICSRWRKVSLSTPSLWTHIELRDRFSHSRNLRLSTDDYSIPVYLKRSLNLPISVVVDFISDNLRIEFMLLCKEASRWRHADIRIHGVLVDMPPNLFDARFVQLETLKLRVEEKKEGAMTLRSGNGPTCFRFDQAKKLKELEIEVAEGLQLRVAGLQSIFGVPLSQIRKLVAVCRWKDAQSLLAQCANAQYVYFREEDSGDFLMGNKPLPYTSKAVTELILSQNEMGDWMEYVLPSTLISTTLPSLSKLTIHGSNTGFHAVLKSFLTRSECLLSHLTLTSMMWSMPQLFEILQLQPSLTHLTIIHAGTDPEGPELGSSETPIILPRLKHLSLTPDLTSAPDPPENLEIYEFFEKCTTPSLTSLELLDCGDRLDPILDILPSFITRSNCGTMLRRLALSCETCDAAKLGMLLAVTPGLEGLVMGRDNEGVRMLKREDDDKRDEDDDDDGAGRNDMASPSPAFEAVTEVLETVPLSSDLEEVPGLLPEEVTQTLVKYIRKELLDMELLEKLTITASFDSAPAALLPNLQCLIVRSLVQRDNDSEREADSEEEAESAHNADAAQGVDASSRIAKLIQMLRSRSSHSELLRVELGFPVQLERWVHARALGSA